MPARQRLSRTGAGQWRHAAMPPQSRPRPPPSPPAPSGPPAQGGRPAAGRAVPRCCWPAPCADGAAPPMRASPPGPPCKRNLPESGTKPVRPGPGLLGGGPPGRWRRTPLPAPWLFGLLAFGFWLLACAAAARPQRASLCTFALPRRGDEEMGPPARAAPSSPAACTHPTAAGAKHAAKACGAARWQGSRGLRHFRPGAAGRVWRPRAGAVLAPQPCQGGRLGQR